MIDRRIIPSYNQYTLSPEKGGMRVKKLFALVLALSLCLLFAPARAESVSGFGRSFTKTTRVLDLSGIGVIPLHELTALMDQLPGLEEALMYDAAFSVQDIDLLRERYPGVFFGVTFRLEDHTVRTDQTAFSTLHNNRSKTHTSADFDFLRHCVRLQALDLGHNAVTDISFVENLTDLKVLILALNGIEDISPLKNLIQLEYLEIFRNKIRDLSPLQGMDQLLDLNLSYNYVSDYSPLYSLSALERLWLYQSNGYNKGQMDRATLREIRAQLPGCDVNGVSGGTNGGWREHPRYPVIFDIFKTSVYKPFNQE